MTTPEMTVNVPLLRKCLEHITAHPEEWEQRMWARKTSCGTSYCLAGRACAETGYDFFFDGGDAHHVASGERVEVAAARELGLSKHQADDMFYAHNSLNELWRYAETFSHREIEVPPELAA